MSTSVPAMTMPSRADINAVTGERPSGSASMRLLRRVFSSTAIKGAVAASVIAPSILSGIDPFHPRDLREALYAAYHLYHGCGPGTPIVWRKEEMPDLLVLAKAMMRQDRQEHPSAPDTPILPAAPVVPPSPAQTPLLPCCGGSLSGVLPSRRGKRGNTAQYTALSLNI